jgi:hypothetical protein
MSVDGAVLQPLLTHTGIDNWGAESNKIAGTCQPVLKISIQIPMAYTITYLRNFDSKILDSKHLEYMVISNIYLPT